MKRLALMLMTAVSVTTAAAPRAAAQPEELPPEEPAAGAASKPAATAEPPKKVESAGSEQKETKAVADEIAEHIKARAEPTRALASAFHEFCSHGALLDHQELGLYFDGIEGEKRKKFIAENQGQLDTASAALAPLCAKLCSAPGADGQVRASVVDFCGLRNKTAAMAASISDWKSIEEITAKIREPLTRMRNATKIDIETVAEPKSALLKLAKADVAFANRAEQQSAAGIVTFSTKAVELALAGLAKLIEDRARREGAGWFLDRMSKDLCAMADDKARAEIRTSWFPALCVLADSNQMVEYGAGAELLRSVRAALESDLRGWPGALAGLTAGAAFWSEVRAPSSEEPISVLSCNVEKVTAGSEKAVDAKCGAAKNIRKDFEKLLTNLIGGGEATQALYALGEALHEHNTHGSGEAKRGYAASFDLTACAATIPRVFRDYGAVSRSAGVRSAEVLSLAALTHSNACANLTVYGATDLAKFGEANEANPKRLAAQAGSSTVERISTILSLQSRIRFAESQLGAATTDLTEAFKRYRTKVEETVKTAPEVGDIAKLPMPEIAEVSDVEAARELMQATERYLRNALTLVQNSGVRETLQASIDAGNASLAVMRVSSETFRSVLDPTLLPGWASRHPALCAKASLENPDKPETPGTCTQWVATPTHKLEAFEASLTRAQSALTSVGAALDKRWDRVVVQAQLALNTLNATSDDTILKNVLKPLGRYAGVVVAMASEEDPDAIARTLDELAAPVGGWRRKQAAPWTVSLAAQPGLFGGGEWRNGQYGVTQNDWDEYWVAPALTLPFGLDVTWKHCPLVIVPDGVFVSLLDPAAYLQYDASAEGRLPGAQITTALAPGFGLRFPVADTPFSFMPIVFFRPNFRAWETQLSGTGANVLQIGLTISIDVTLWELAVGHE